MGQGTKKALGALTRLEHKQTSPNWYHYPVHILDLEFEIQESFRLPAFAGSMFRGCFGWALKEVCQEAVYTYLFETTSTEPGQTNATRPFILVPPLGSRSLQPGDRFGLKLRLFGHGCEHLVDIVAALELAGKRGLGSSKARFKLCRVNVHDGTSRWVMYDHNLGWERSYLPQPAALGAFSRQSKPFCKEITIDFLTPTRLIRKGKRVTEPEFHIILRALYRRVSSLFSLHGKIDNFPTLEEFVEGSSDVQAWHDLEWADWERHSNRQHRKHIMGGLVGTSRYRGVFRSQWLELLTAGELTHLGKGTTFGMGLYSVS